MIGNAQSGGFTEPPCLHDAAISYPFPSYITTYTSIALSHYWERIMTITIQVLASPHAAILKGMLLSRHLSRSCAAACNLRHLAASQKTSFKIRHRSRLARFVPLNRNGSGRKFYQFIRRPISTLFWGGFVKFRFLAKIFNLNFFLRQIKIFRQFLKFQKSATQQGRYWSSYRLIKFSSRSNKI